jgi:putative membrane protein
VQEIVVEHQRRHSFWFRWLANTGAILLAGLLVSGVHVAGLPGAAVAALVLAAVNAVVRPLLIFFTLPITILTLGLFVLVVNGLSVGLAAWISGGLFDIDGLFAAILAWIVISLTNWIVSSLFRRKTVRVHGGDGTGLA